MKNKKGFTLIELLAVVVIIGLLIAIAFPAISKYTNETRNDVYSLHEAELKTATSNMMSKCVQGDVDGCVPDSGGSRTVYLNELIAQKYSNAIKDPAKSNSYCDADKTYVVVTNTKNNVVDLEYQVCLVCSKYQSAVCETVAPDNKCDKTIDPDGPVCGDAIGSSTIWTNSDRVISLGCSDTGCGCTQGTYYQRFEETAKQGVMTIVDKAGNTTDCVVDVYVDKEVPKCELEVVGTLGEQGWYGGAAPVVKFKSDPSKIKDTSGIATYGIGLSSKNPNLNKETSYTVSPGITTVFGYVKDNAGNVGFCKAEVKYDNVVPTSEIAYGYQVYPKSDIATTSGQYINLNSFIKEYGNVLGANIYLKSNSGGMSVTIYKGSTEIAKRTISAGVKSMKFTFSGTYDSLKIDMGSASNIALVDRIELITDHTSGFYTNKDIYVYATSHDSFSGKGYYSFDGEAWQESNRKTYTANLFAADARTKDYAGNISNKIEFTVNNIDKLKPNDVTFNPNGGNTYKINVGETTTSFSTIINATDREKTTDYSMSGIRSVIYAWTTTISEPTSWVATSEYKNISRTSTGGSNYLWIKTVDKAGNEKIIMSNNFDVGYQVLYDCNDGSGCPDSQRKEKDVTLVLSNSGNVPTRSGYQFMGWGTTKSSTTTSYDRGSSYTNNVPIKLYAIWKKTLSFNFIENGANLNTYEVACDIFNSDASCNITLPTISRSEFNIKGFNTNKDSKNETSNWTSGATVTVSSNTARTWYAITNKSVTIKFEKNNASSISSKSATCTIWNNNSSCSVTSPTITAPSNTPTVVGFNTSSSATTSQWSHGTSKSVDRDATYYAITKKSGRTLYVYYNDNGGTGSTSSSSCTISDTYNGATQGSSCSLSLRSNGFSRTGYSFGGWSTNKSATSGLSAGTSVSLNSDATYYAIWKSTNNYNKLFERRFSLTYEMIDGIYTPTKVTIYDELTCMDDEAKYCKYTSLNGTSEVGTFSDLNTYDKDTVKDNFVNYSKGYTKPFFSDKYFKEQKLKCYKKTDDLSDYEEYSWCEDWMNGNNGDFDPNYIAVWKTTKEGWYFSRSYDCYLKAVDLSDSVDSENYKACAIEEDEKHKYPNPPNS